MNKEEQLKVLSMLTTRLLYASKLGMQYGGNRDLYEALGYPKDLTYNDYYTQYRRQDIASAIIDRPVNTTWRGTVSVVDGTAKADTSFEKEWNKLWKEAKLKVNLTRLDRLTSIGRYGVLLLGTDDISNIQQMAKPLKRGSKLLYVRAFSEPYAQIVKYYDDPRKKEYGRPELYNLQTMEPNNQKIFTVHESRVIHVAYETMGDSLYGTPVLQKVFNRLLDLEKIVGGSAEMFWRGARPGYQGKLDSDYEMSKDMEEDLQKQIDEYEHNLRRILVNEGLTFSELKQQVSDPLNHVDIQISMISAKTGIPKRILLGTERGELASSQDMAIWYSLIEERRVEIAETNILRPFIDHLIKYNILPKPKEDSFDFTWEPLHYISDKEKADIGRLRAIALKTYGDSSSATKIVHPKAFLRYMLGMDELVVDKILQLTEEETPFESPALEAAKLRQTAINDDIENDPPVDPTPKEINVNHQKNNSHEKDN